ncbi:hypothetical protein Tco_0054520, partial [Tanacetum coccineum]
MAELQFRMFKDDSLKVVDHVHAFDSDCDDAPTASAISWSLPDQSMEMMLMQLMIQTYSLSWGVSHIKDAYEEEVIPFVKNLTESFTLFEKGLYKEVNEMKAIFKQIEIEIFENAKLKAQLQAKFSEPQLNQNGTSVNTKFEKPPTSGHTTQFIPKVVEKIDLSKIVTLHMHTVTPPKSDCSE